MSADAFVLDASVLIAAVLPNEPFHPDANALMRRLTDAGACLYVSTIVFAEIAAAIARGAGDEQLALAVVAQYATRADLHQIEVDVALGVLATEIAARQRIRGCDAVYVALAHMEQAILVTLDGRASGRRRVSLSARQPRRWRSALSHEPLGSRIEF